MIIDGTNLLLGRLASYTAKQALFGEEIQIINCEKVIMTGTKSSILERLKEKKNMGGPYKGPFTQKLPDRIVRRSIRGMLPYKQERGKTAYKRVMCYIGIPTELQGKEYSTVDGANAKKLQTLNFMNLKEIAQYLGKYV